MHYSYLQKHLSYLKLSCPISAGRIFVSNRSCTLDKREGGNEFQLRHFPHSQTKTKEKKDLAQMAQNWTEVGNLFSLKQSLRDNATVGGFLPIPYKCCFQLASFQLKLVPSLKVKLKKYGLSESLETTLLLPNWNESKHELNDKDEKRIFQILYNHLLIIWHFYACMDVQFRVCTQQLWYETKPECTLE